MKRIILTLLLIGLGITALYSIIVEIGDGTTTTTYIPCSRRYKYSWSTYILTAEQIGCSMQISKIQFELNDTLSRCEMKRQQIYLKHTVANEVSNLYPDPVNNGFTLVFDQHVIWQGSSWQGVSLDTKFTYDGISNLQIVWLNNYGARSESTPNFKVTDTEFNAGSYKVYDDSFPENFLGDVVSYFPNTRLNGVLLETAMTSILPTNNTVNQSLTPTISFEVASTYANFELSFGETLNLGTILIPHSPVINPISYTFTEPLAYLTDYYWRVTLYATNDEEISYNFTFTTLSSLEGLGTIDNPYLVNSISDLVLISSDDNLWNKHFIQTSNIDASSTRELNEGTGFSPIGSTLKNSFTGSYAGQGYIISDLYINRPTTICIGLFGHTKEADISNLGLENVDITGDKYVGGLAGVTSSNISNCYATGTVSGIDRVGGLVGLMSASFVNNSYATSSVSGTGVIGGLIGLRTNGSVSNSFWDIETSGKDTSAGGAGKTTAEMKDRTTYTNWDFDTIWAISEKYNDGYPHLAASWQPTLPVELTSFITTMTSNYFSQILWSTASETNLVGFNIYRSDNRNIESASRINRIYIPAANSSHGSDYSYIDETVEMNSTYYYWLESTELDGFVEFFGPLSVRIGQQTGQIGPLITVSHIKGNYPNPFNPETTIEFFVQANETAQLTIYNLKGQIVRSPELFGAGKHRHYWNGTDNCGKQVASGIYLYRLKTESYESVRKMVIEK